MRLIVDIREEPVRHHLKNVYSCLAMVSLTAGAGGYLQVVTGMLEGSLLVPLGTIVLLIGLLSTPDNGKNSTTRLGMLFGFAFLSGLGVGPLLTHAIHVNPSILPTALLATGMIFICFTLGSLYTQKRYWLFLSGILMSGLTLTFVLGLASILFMSNMLFQVHLYLGLLLMCGFVVYDTQLIVEKRRLGDKDFIRHSLDLFVDVFSIFRRLLIILTQKEQSQRRRSD